MKKDKYYINAYNNPSQFNIEGFKDKENLSSMQNSILKGVTDAFKDRENGTYKFKN